MYEALREGLRRVVKEHSWSTEKVSVIAKAISPEEAIGNPEKNDYPLAKGRERIMEACFQGARGHAFTDMFGDFRGVIDEILEMDLTNNFRRALFVAALNAVLRSAGMAHGTVHCKDQAPQECSEQLLAQVRVNIASGGRSQRLLPVGSKLRG